MLASFVNMGYIIFGAATVQMLLELCSNNSGSSVQVRRNTHWAPIFDKNVSTSFNALATATTVSISSFIANYLL
jgi:hypothetical protein